MRLFLLLVIPLITAQAQPLTLQAETATGRSQFQMGEAIAVKLTFTRAAGSPENWQVSITSGDRSVLGFDGDRFLVSPETGTADPWAYRAGKGIVYSGPGGMFLRGTTTSVQVDLNQWIRFKRSGQYRIHALFHARGPGDAVLESNEFPIEIIPRDAAAQQVQLKNDIAILNALPVKPDQETFEARMNAARRISYLDTPGSVRESASLLGTMDVQVCHILRNGLLGSQHREIATAAMKELLSAPTQPVTPQFLDTLSDLDGNASFDLAAAIEHKLGSAKAISLSSFLNELPMVPAPANVRLEMAGMFHELPPAQQAELLNSQWTKIAGPEMIPALLSTHTAIAMERLNEVAPSQARPILLEELARPEPSLPYRALSILPDATLPQLDQTFLANLEKNNQTSELIARYASAAILDQVKAYYEKRDAMMRKRTSSNVREIAAPACEPALIAYFLRTDAAFGEQQLRRTLAERAYPTGRCWMSIIGRTASYYVSPEWEKVAIAALQDPTVAVKSDAAKALGEHGSPGSRAAVLDSFRYWHEWWKDRPELNMDSRQFEQVLLNATSRTADPGLIRELCLTPWCRSQADDFRAQRK